jgi:hypothetical protein
MAEADELGEHFGREAVDVHDCFGGTERTDGEQSECSALFAAETTFSRPHGDVCDIVGIAGHLPVRAGQVKERVMSVQLGHSRRISVV